MLIEINCIQLFCSHLLFVKWLQNFLLPCPFKYLTGIDCPGCGFQRSVLALLQGDMHDSFALYPATIPLLLFFSYGIAGSFYKLDTEKGPVKKVGFMVMALLITVSYAVKIYHYTKSA